VAEVILTPESQAEFDALPVTVRIRVLNAFGRLGMWPEVSGVKWLKYDWIGYARIRVGDWRVICAFVAPDVIVVRILNRRDVYED
jgi:mRNA-degrading endonuclease RelE of RelBE toxin-antitoxin system